MMLDNSTFIPIFIFIIFVAVSFLQLNFILPQLNFILPYCFWLWKCMMKSLKQRKTELNFRSRDT